MVEFLFNLIFLFLLVRLYGDQSRDFYFNPLYRRITQWSDPLYRFLGSIMPFRSQGSVPVFLLFLFLLLRAMHYYAYRGSWIGMEWGPAMMIWKVPSFSSAFMKAVLTTMLFYFHFLMIVLLLEWVSWRMRWADPILKIVQTASAWPKTWIQKSRWAYSANRVFLGSFIIVALILSVIFYLVLVSFGQNIVLVPGGQTPIALFFKTVILNLFLACTFFRVLFYLLLLRALLSWFFPYGLAGTGQLVLMLTEPILQLFSRWNLRAGPFDFSILIAILLCLFLDQFFKSLLIRLYLLF